MSINASLQALVTRTLLLAALLVPGLAAADSPRYVVVNETDKTLNFSTLDPARGTWRQQTIAPGQRRSFVWASGAEQGKVRIRTDGRGYVQYDIHANQRYAIVWDSRKGVWDFRSRGPLGAQRASNDGYRSNANYGGGQSNRYGNGGRRTASENVWTLFNRSNERLEFQTFDYARGSWRNQVSHPHQRTSYRMGGNYTQGKVRISTRNRGYVEYDVHAGGSYTLVWDRNKGMWDFRTRSGG